jgi:phosphoglycerate dehydrogenase-like enzyme
VGNSSADGNGSGGPSVLVVPPPSLYRKLFSAESDARLRELASFVRFNHEERDWNSEELARRIGEFDVVITGWRSPRFTSAVLEAARARPLKLVAHSAGSVKFLLEDEQSLARDFMVTTAAAAMGPAVAEMALLAMMMLLRPLHTLDAGLKSGGDWAALKASGAKSQRELIAQRVGVIGAGHTGRHFIRMVRALGVHTVVFDPYAGDQLLAELDAERADSLDELLGECTVLALHAPSTPETRHMIGKRELSLMPDGAVLVNTARASLIDSDALLDELRTGRISAALDVFDEEPLPADSPFRGLSNVILTPHIASHTASTYFRQGELTVDEVQRFVKGETLRYEVTPQMLATMA